MINGKVARILSETEVVLNVGRQHGVQEGTEFVIFANSDPIIDPDTGENLGMLEIVKGRVRVSHVMDQAARASTTTYEVQLPSTLAMMSLGMDLPRTETRWRTLRVKSDQIKPISEDLIVVVGDLVRSV